MLSKCKFNKREDLSNDDIQIFGTINGFLIIHFFLYNILSCIIVKKRRIARKLHILHYTDIIIHVMRFFVYADEEITVSIKITLSKKKEIQ